MLWYHGEPRPVALNTSSDASSVSAIPPIPGLLPGFTDSDAQRIFSARVKAAAEATPAARTYQPNRHERRRAKILSKRKG